jgi:excisionase family DNA binding protein
MALTKGLAMGNAVDDTGRGGQQRQTGSRLQRPAVSHATPGVTRLMDIEALADLLDVNVRHVRRLVAERRIPFLKWGRLLRFDAEEIAVWLEEARVPAQSPGMATGAGSRSRSLRRSVR